MRITPIIKLIVTAYISPQLHGTGSYEFTFANGTKWSAPTGRHPTYSQGTLRWMENENRIDFSGSEPRAKRYLAEVQEGQPPDAILAPEIVGFNSDGTRELAEIFERGGVFPQPKTVKLMKFLLEILRSQDAIILDSSAGSGTTAHAVLALNKEDGGNRKFILVECEDYADSITAERVRRVINGVPGARDAALREGLGGSFTYCTWAPP
jgi:adenine-specific DNA-methyltransferase